MVESANETSMRRFLEQCACSELPLVDLCHALTHRSHAYEASLECDNERLEFLGDAIISAVASEILYLSDPCADEGCLSKRRARLVSRAVLGKRAEALGIGDLMLLGRGERETGGARRRSILGSALEAVVGVVYIRLGFNHARQFVIEQIVNPLLATQTGEEDHEDYKSALQEWTQGKYHLVPSYSLVSEQGPDHDKSFTVRVNLDGRMLAEGTGRRIKSAENEAARLALEVLEGESR